MSVTIEDTDLPKVAPLAHIPRVRYTDANGRIHEGWYAFHVNRQLSPFESCGRVHGPVRRQRGALRKAVTDETEERR